MNSDPIRQSQLSWTCRKWNESCNIYRLTKIMECATTHPICNYKAAQSDASFLSRPRARSVFGGLFYLGCREAINGPIVCTSKMKLCVVASAAEAELAAGFQLAQIAVRLRNTMHDFGYPQQPTLLLIDNTAAIGLLDNTVAF